MGKSRFSKPQKSSSSGLEHRRWLRDGATIVGCLGALVALWLPLWHLAPHSWRRWYVKEWALGPLLQVVPATVVAVFVFAVGAVFVIVQIISPTLGSRAIEDLLVRRLARACVIAGIILLLACLALTALARIRSQQPELWEASAASSLALASLIYVPFAIWCISSVFHRFVSPSAYSRLLSQWRGQREPLAAESAFHQLRALRQWLRTACRTGESRDIVFALEGFQDLLRNYCDKARAPQKDKPPNKERKPENDTYLDKKLREEPPDEYIHTGNIVNSPWRMLLYPKTVAPNEMPRKGWFGDEFGRALARCAEVGIRSGVLLRRDLDRLLVVLGGATLQLAGFKEPEGGVIGPVDDTSLSLPEEAGFLLDRIAEIGMYAFQFQDKPYSDWFVRPALVLARLEHELEGLNAQVTGPPWEKHSLAGRALAAWCLVNYIFQQSKDSAHAKGDPSAYGWHELGGQAKNNDSQLWGEATSLANSTAMHPSWMPLIHDEQDGKQGLDTFLGRVQAGVAAKPQPQNQAFSDDLNEWIIGGCFHAVSEPDGGAFLGRVVAADDYRGVTVTFRGEVHAQDVTEHAELRLHVLSCDRSQSVRKHGEAIAGSHDWTWYEVTEAIPGHVELIRFSLTLTGPGRVGLRNMELTRTS